MKQKNVVKIVRVYHIAYCVRERMQSVCIRSVLDLNTYKGYQKLLKMFNEKFIPYSVILLTWTELQHNAKDKLPAPFFSDLKKEE